MYPKLSSDSHRESHIEHINMLLNAHGGKDAQLNNKIFLKYLTNQIITKKHNLFKFKISVKDQFGNEQEF